MEERKGAGGVAVCPKVKWRARVLNDHQYQYHVGGDNVLDEVFDLVRCYCTYYSFQYD